MTRPTLADYGTYDESEFPELANRVLRSWSPCLGVTGSRVPDLSRASQWGTLTGMDAATDWTLGDGAFGLDFDGVDDWVDFGANSFAGTNFTVVSWFKILTAGSHFPYSTSSAANASGIELLYGPSSVFSQIASRISSGAAAVLTHNFGSTAAALANPICFVQCFSDSQPTKTHTIFVNGGNRQSTTYTANTASSQNWSWAKRGTTFFAAGGGGAITNGTCRWFEQIVFRGIFTDTEASAIYSLGPGGLFQRRRKHYAIFAEEAAFRAPWATRSRSIIGGGIR